MTVPIAGYQITLNDDPFLNIALTIFCAGCWHNCEQCQQPQLQNPGFGKPTEVEEVKKEIKTRTDLVKSVVFCGGDFGYYQNELVELLKYCKRLNLTTIFYTGFFFEELHNDVKKLCDVVIDGKFISMLSQSSFPPSENQRVFILGKEVDVNILPINKKKKE